jgi:HEAT repeat protein
MLGPPPLPRNLEASLRDLDSARADVRASAIEDLVRHARGDDGLRTRAMRLVGKRLKDDDARVRAAAAVALGDLRALEHVDDLVAAVDDADAHVRQMALNALGEIEDRRGQGAPPPDTPETRLRTRSLRSAFVDRALPRLRTALKDARPEMRYQAIIAFARVADESPDIGQAILDATNDKDDAVAHIAFRIAEERLDDGIRPEERLLARARALHKKGTPNLALVAAIFLAKAGDDEAHATLLNVVKSGRIRGVSPEKEDERAAVELVGELGLEEAVPALERRAFGLTRHIRDTCTFHAKIALARMGHKRAIEEIMRDLDATRPDVLGAAVVAAGRARLVLAKAKIQRLTSAAMDPDLVKEALRRLSEK